MSLKTISTFITFSIISLNAFAEHPENLVKFIENKGQWPAQVLYRADIPAGNVFIERGGLVYNFADESKMNHPHGKTLENTAYHSQSRLTNHHEDLIAMHSVRLRFLGSSTVPEITSLSKSSEKYNFFKGKDPSKWAGGADAYHEIYYKNLYQGVHLHLKKEADNLKYDVIVDAGADIKKIQFQYIGASAMYLEDDRLHVKTSINELIEDDPFAFQLVDNKRVIVPCRYKLTENIVTFEFPQGYDATKQLIIDPVLIFSSYSGSTADNWGNTATYDNEGNLYSGGIVSNYGFPATTGAYNQSFSGVWDVGILKFDSAGQNLLYATYLGGSEAETPQSMIVNSKNELVVLGVTSSLDFAIHPFSIQNFFLGGSLVEPIGGVVYHNGTDLFVVKFSPDGSELRAATYLGSTGNDGINIKLNPLVKNYGDQLRGEVIVDKDDNIFIASVSNSESLVEVGNFHNTRGGKLDAIIVGLSSNLDQYLLSMYLGGSSDDAAYSLKFNIQGKLCVTGGTTSSDFPVTQGVLNPLYSGNVDGFVTILDLEQGILASSTYVGTSAYDQTYFLDLDSEGDVWVLGQSKGDIPITPGVYNNDGGGQFIQEFSSDLASLKTSLTFGSGEKAVNLSLTAFTVNDCGNILLSGWGGYINFPYSSGVYQGYVGGSTNNMFVTENAFQKTTDGSDFYFMVLSKDARELMYATYFGSPYSPDHVDGGTSRFDKRGIIYQSICAGCGGDSNFPTTPTAWSRYNRSGKCNNAAIKFDLANLNAEFTPDEKEGCHPHTVTFKNNSFNGSIFSWDFGDGNTSNHVGSVSHTYELPGVYIVSLKVEDRNTCIYEDYAYDTVTVLDSHFDVKAKDSVCLGETVQLKASGATTYYWTPSHLFNNVYEQNPAVTPAESRYFYVEMVDENSCYKKDSIYIKVLPTAKANFYADKQQGCPPLSVRFDNLSTGSSYFKWDFGDGSFSQEKEVGSYLFEDPGTYHVRLTILDTMHCKRPEVFTKTIEVHQINFDAASSATICYGASHRLWATGGNSYFWSPSNGLDNTSISSPIASPKVTTDYVVTISDRNGCEKKDTVKITVLDEMKLRFRILKEPNCKGITAVKLINESIGIDKFLWDFGDGKTSADKEPFYVYSDTGVYIIQLEGLEQSCINSINEEVNVKRTLIPNVITPDNFDIVNQYFSIISDVPVGVKIFNRWGREVFSDNEYKNNWSGSNVSEGVYYYEATFPNNKVCTGWLHVLK